MSTTAHWRRSSRLVNNAQGVIRFSGCGSPQPSKEGPLAQLVERHAYTVDVIGSIPVGPTNGKCRGAQAPRHYYLPMDSSQFLPPTPRALGDQELQEVLEAAKRDGGGVLAAMQILEAQAQLRETDKSELHAWRVAQSEREAQAEVVELPVATVPQAEEAPVVTLADPTISSEEQDATAADELLYESAPELVEQVSTPELVEQVSTPELVEVTVVVPNKRNAKDSSSSQFWVWLTISGSLLPFGIALWLQSLGLTFSQSLVAAALGLFVSAGVVAIGAIAGKRSSLPTLVLSRAAFGVLGNLAPATVLVLSRLFWLVVLVFLGYLLIAQSYGSAGSISGVATTISWISVAVLGIIVTSAVVLSSLGGKTLVWAQRLSGVVGVTVALTVSSVRISASGFNQSFTEQGSWLRALGAAVVVFAVFGLAWSSASADYASGLPVKVRGWRVVTWALLSLGLVPTGLAALGLIIFSDTSSRHFGSTFNALIAGSDGLTPLGIAAQASLVLTLVTSIAMSLRSSSLSFESIRLKIKVSLATPILAFVAVGLAIFGFSRLGSAGFWFNLQGYALVIAVPVAAWSGIFISDVLIRRIAYHEVSLSRSYGFYRAVNVLNLCGWVVAVAIGWGLLRSELVEFQWLGYLSDYASNREFWSQSNFGVVIAFAIGLLLPVFGGIPRIKRQEAEVLQIEARRNDLNNVMGDID